MTQNQGDSRLLSCQWGPVIPGTNASGDHVLHEFHPVAKWRVLPADRFVKESAVYPSRDWDCSSSSDRRAKSHVFIGAIGRKTCLEFVLDPSPGYAASLFSLGKEFYGLSEAKKPPRVLPSNEIVTATDPIAGDLR